MKVAIVGAACRLPGAENERTFHRNLIAKTSSLRTWPEGRWSAERFFHPDKTALGFSYSFAGGYLDAPYDFDPSVFGITPREAVQMDPQQRLLLEVVWEALENANLVPSQLAGEEIGVYVGASSLDYSNQMLSDPSLADGYFMTGNTLSVISNRISHVFDWHGPSFTVDTACSSSLVALNQAMADLRLGRVDTAIVAGVHLLLSPAAFIGFSRATMLSPTNMCRPFSAAADGYVRGEGSAAFVLRRADLVQPGEARAYVRYTALNSDGKTSGIALPGVATQQALLEKSYAEAGIAPEQLAFVEAHGTGTRIGDPAEAVAIGRALGAKRTAPLPIGSVKSNIGHLEPASGVAGLMKALLALETRVLPATLHLEALNPDIDFEALNLTPAIDNRPLDPEADSLFCGVSSFGFGGTNAHAILESAPRSGKAAAPPAADMLMISAATPESLRALSSNYAERLEAGQDPRILAAATAVSRERMRHRVAMSASLPASELATALRQFADTGRSPTIAHGSAASGRSRLCFVYSGNGTQWPGMGCDAYKLNGAFRTAFDEVTEAFAAPGDESLVKMLFTPRDNAAWNDAGFVQPLLLAVQYAITKALAAEGIEPDLVVGHSAGEVGAAVVAGALSLKDAARVTRARVNGQETVRGMGTMATLAASRAAVEELLRELGRGTVEIAAENGPSSVTISGTEEAVKAALAKARLMRIAGRGLNLAYPFHSRLLAKARDQFLGELGELEPRRPTVPLISTVTGELVGPEGLSTDYWWSNIQQEVRFMPAVETALSEKSSLFLEIGPRPALLSPIIDTAREKGVTITALPSLTQTATPRANEDPIRWVALQALAHGAALRNDAPARVGRSVTLPNYPFHRSTFRFEAAKEGVDLFGREATHPLIGSRIYGDGAEWRSVIDPALLPYLTDHRLEDTAVLPATAYAEMVLAVARQIAPEGPVGFEDLDILQALGFSGGARDVRVQYAEITRNVEIASRPRGKTSDWVIHARARLADVATPPRATPLPAGELTRSTGARIYAAAASVNIHYGPGFRLCEAVEYDGETMISRLTPSSLDTGPLARPHLIDPASADAALHGLFLEMKDDGSGFRPYLPIRMGRARLYREHARIVSAVTELHYDSAQLARASITLLDEEGSVAVQIDDILLKATSLAHGSTISLLHTQWQAARRQPLAEELTQILRPLLAEPEQDAASEALWVLQACLRASAFEAFRKLAGKGRVLDLARLHDEGTITTGALGFAYTLQEDLIVGGLAEETHKGIRLNAKSGLPSAGRILSTFAADYPQASAELMIAARLIAELPDFLRTGEPWNHGRELGENFNANALVFAPGYAAIGGALAQLSGALDGRVPEVLLAGQDSEGLLAVLMPLAGAGHIRLAIADLDEASLDMTGVPEGAVRLIDLGADHGLSPSGLFDVAVINGWRLATEATEPLLGRLGRVMNEQGAVIALCPISPTLPDMLFGMQEGWFSASLAPSLPMGSAVDADALAGRMRAAGWHSVTQQPTGEATARLILARPPTAPAIAVSRVEVEAIPGMAPGLLSAAFETVVAIGSPNETPSTLVFLEPGAETRQSDIAATLARLRDLFDRKQPTGGRATAPRVWLALQQPTGKAGEAYCQALWAFGRVAINEYSDLDIRMARLTPGIDPEIAAGWLRELVAQPGEEREFLITADEVKVMRVEKGASPSATPATAPAALSLEHRTRADGRSGFLWTEKARRTPEPDEVEVEIAASGLNFRDVMLSMGLLNDDVLEAGMAGAVLGFECAGHVVAVGSNVSHLKVGDAVAGFARQTFSTHVTSPAQCFISLPGVTTLEAAASIPVAFLTAWYGLIELARLKRGESVLIHGAAGGVGLAAIQIAKARGARVIATVSNPYKRGLVELAGAESVHDSRSLGFADTIRDTIGGVDVVLNSLSGEAMRASVKCLKPFGRFIELGKRDYVANSTIGLRPFRQNLTYYGVDVDQLIAHDPAIVQKGLKQIIAGFARGTYVPLPYRAFPAEQVEGAFRLMRKAGHVGKIIVTPPAITPRAPAAKPAFTPGEGVHLVVGGTRGFGAEVALWLGEQGARNIVVASRSGLIDAALAERIAKLQAEGVSFEAETVDVTDAGSVEALFARVNARHGAIVGIYHAAMVLEDGLIRNLTADNLDTVLTPKIAGGRNLDRASRGQPIEHFLLFSSAATLIGNPGQGAYATANAYLEGLARTRREEGLPAIALCWGPIADSGVLTRNAGGNASTRQLLENAGLATAEALSALGEVLANADSLADPVVYCLKSASTALIGELPIGRSAAFSLFRAAKAAGGATGTLDLAEMIAGKSEREAQDIICGSLLDTLSRILKMPSAEIDRNRPLMEIGLDSLMSLELKMEVERALGCEISVTDLSATQTINQLAGRLLTLIRVSSGANQADEERERNLALHRTVLSVYGQSSDTQTIEPRRVERLQ